MSTAAVTPFRSFVRTPLFSVFPLSFRVSSRYSDEHHHHHRGRERFIEITCTGHRNHSHFGFTEFTVTSDSAPPFVLLVLSFNTNQRFSLIVAAT